MSSLADEWMGMFSDPQKWTHAEAVAVCKQIEAFAPQYGYHVGLTGGLLYKDGERKDLDIMLYQIRGVNPSDLKPAELVRQLIIQCGWSKRADYGFVIKFWDDKMRSIDVLWPDEGNGHYNPEAALQIMETS